MVDQIRSTWGFGLFAIIIAVMTICAGVASCPPAHDRRVFWGAVLLLGLWVSNAFFLRVLGIDTSSQFVLDILVTGAFYYLSKPDKSLAQPILWRNDWASYVVVLLVFITVLEIMHFLMNETFQAKSIFFGIMGAALIAIFIGLVRGFGLNAAIVFAIVIALTFLFARYAYSLVLNILMICAYLIVTVRAVRSASANAKEWARNLFTASPPRKKSASRTENHKNE